MGKRLSRLHAITHEYRQLEVLKVLDTNRTPTRYRALSDGLIDVALSTLDIVAALEVSDVPNFERLYALVDGLADLVDDHEADDSSDGTGPASHSAPVAATPLEGIKTMKTTLVGRPDRIEVNGDTIVLHMSFSPKPPANGVYGLPKGVPDPQPISTPVIAYVGRKQFEKVKDQLDQPGDVLIIEGAISQIVDSVLTIYASNISSKFLQADAKAAVKAAKQKEAEAQS